MAKSKVIVGDNNPTGEIANDIAKQAVVQTPATIVEMTGQGTATNSKAFMKTVLGSSAKCFTTLADSCANLV